MWHTAACAAVGSGEGQSDDYVMGSTGVIRGFLLHKPEQRTLHKSIRSHLTLMSRTLPLHLTSYTLTDLRIVSWNR